MNRIEKVSMVIDYMEANLTKKIDLDMIAEAVHYSKYHLHRVFSKTVGITIHDYLQRRQLTEAAKLLVFLISPSLILLYCRDTKASRHLQVFLQPCINSLPTNTGKMKSSTLCN